MLAGIIPPAPAPCPASSSILHFVLLFIFKILTLPAPAAVYHRTTGGRGRETLRQVQLEDGKNRSLVLQLLNNILLQNWTLK